MLLGEQNLYQILSRYANVGWVTKKEHPHFRWAIFHYSQETEHNKYWDQYTMMARGIVVQHDGTILIRPMKKFMNDDQVDLSAYQATNTYYSRYRVFEKLDGSLINMSLVDGCIPIITTKNSFEGPQIRAAGDYVRNTYLGFGWMQPGLTYCFEWIAPENRITVSYEDRRELVLLAVIENESGVDFTISFDDDNETWGWPGSVAPQYTALSSQPLDLLHDTIGTNQEGYVLRFSDGQRLKVKGEWFKTAHRARWGLTERAIWKAYRYGDEDALITMRKALEDDDEAREWFDQKYLALADQVGERVHYARTVVATIPADTPRKDVIAMLREVSETRESLPLALLIAVFDDDLGLAENIILDDLKPAHSPFVPTRQFSEQK